MRLIILFRSDKDVATVYKGRDAKGQRKDGKAIKGQLKGNNLVTEEVEVGCREGSCESQRSVDRDEIGAVEAGGDFK